MDIFVVGFDCFQFLFLSPVRLRKALIVQPGYPDPPPGRGLAHTQHQQKTSLQPHKTTDNQKTHKKRIIILGPARLDWKLW